MNNKTPNDDALNSAIPFGQIDLSDDNGDMIEELTILETGETSVSGSTPSVDSDDNMLENAHDVGLYLDANDEEPSQLNIAEQIEQAEKYHKDH